MLCFPQNSFTCNCKEERNVVDAKDMQNVERFVETFMGSVQEDGLFSAIAPITDAFPISQKHSPYSALPFGKIGTVGEAGCGPLAVEYAFRVCGFSVSFEEILEECISKGYRAYIFDEKDTIIDGSGTETAFFDNVATMVDTLPKLLLFLKRGCPVTVRMSNAVLYQDEHRAGNHFITLVGMDAEQNLVFMDGNLIVNDPSEAFSKKPLLAMVRGFKGAWAWEKEKISRFLS